MTDEQRDNRDIASQRRLDLDPDEVGRVIESRLAVLPAHRQPVIADHGQENLALADRLIEHLAEIHAEGDVVDVGEHRLIAELLAEEIVDMAGDVGCVIPAVGDEYVIGHALGDALFFQQL